MDPIITEYLNHLELGEAQSFNNMTLFPLFSSLNGSPPYLSMGEAMGKSLLTVTEVDQGGTVPELKVVNRADLPVLLLDGEELAGAKQNRVLNTTILIVEKSGTLIPVSCTEQGRWSYISADFMESGNIMSHSIRLKKASSVSLSLKECASYRGNQGEVWDKIEDLSRAAGVCSRTGAMREVYEGKKKDLDDYMGAFPFIPSQKGVIVLINGEVVGFDLLSLSPVYEAIHPKLVKSYAMDASLQQMEHSGNGSVEKAKVFIGEARQGKGERFKSVGHGWDHRFEGPGVVGSALVHEEKVIHMAFFRMGKSEKAGKMSASSRRRRFRVQ